MAYDVHDRPPGSVLLLILAVALAFGGGWLADRTRTDQGAVAVRTVTFQADDGRTMAAELYVPNGATADAPAPGVLAVHGYLNDRETQSPYAIELARRGYVVLALDQPGHGLSDPPAFAGGFGGPAGLAHLRTLDMVDPDRIALIGHSMGGWAVLIAAGTAPDAYDAIAISGSSTGTLGAPEGTPRFPRNLGLIFSRYDEFSELMWGAPTAPEIVSTDKLATLFGTEPPVVPGRVYGDVDAGTARWLVQPPVTHPGDHITTVGVAPVLDWLARTVPAPTPLASSDQVWPLKELGTGLGLLGAILWLFAFGGLLLRVPPFSALRRVPARGAATGGPGWWLAAGVLAIVPAATYLWLTNATTGWFPPNALFPQQLTNGIALWASANAVLALLGFAVWSATTRRERGNGAGLLRGPVLGLGHAILNVGGAYALLAGVHALFGTDFRAWVLALRPLDAGRAEIALPYLAPFGLFFVALALVLHGQLRAREATAPSAAATGNAVLVVSGIAGFLLIQYLALFSGLPLPFGDPLMTIVAIQLLVLLPVAAALSTALFETTGSIWPGAFANTLFVTWYVVASQATHVVA